MEKRHEALTPALSQAETEKNAIAGECVGRDNG